MNVDGIASGASYAGLTPTPSGDPKLEGAAKQFEALMVGEILKSARESSDAGWLGTDSDESGSLAVEMGEQQFAQAIADRGGLGIAKMVMRNLAPHPTIPSSSGSPPSHPSPSSTDSKP
jgi:Rod binding domain-containing protein